MEALLLSISDKAYLNFLTNTDHVERVVSFHLVFLTQVNLTHPLNSIEFSYRVRVHCEYLTILNCKWITSAFHLLSSLRKTGETSHTPLLKNKNIKIFCKVSRTPVRLPRYCKIIFENIWLGTHISIHFILKTEEREDVNKYACLLLSDSEPLGNNGDQLWVYTCQIDRETSLGRGVTMVGFCPINEHWRGH